jgi:hydroxyacylglutathione hydrolase
MTKFVMGELQSNSYLFLIDKNEGILFDCGGTRLNNLFEYIEDNNIKLKALILTHGHIDHIVGANILMDKYKDLILYIGEEEKVFLKDSNYNLSTAIYREDFEIEHMDRVEYVKGGDIIFGFEVIDTPGHTIGGKSYYNKEQKVVVVGDTMFYGGGMGRTDFPTGDMNALSMSIKKLCDTLDDEVVVCSGHGKESNMGYEKRMQGLMNINY